MKKIGIYKITNKINGKCYIGQSKNIYKRWKQEKLGCVNEHLKFAFKKYGFENFSFEILEECEINVLNERETYYIDLYDSCNREHGYNKIKVGCVPEHHLPLSEDHKRKISLSNKGRILTVEEINKRKESFKTRIVSNQQVIYCYETNLYYTSIGDASRKLNLAKNALRRVARGIEQRVQNYHFCTIDDDIDAFIEKCDKIYKYISENNITLTQYYTRKANKFNNQIRCIETGVIYDSVHEASRKLNINRSVITESAINKSYNSLITQYHFEYLNEKDKNRTSPVDEEKQKEINKKISDVAKGRKLSEETIEKLRKINTGKKLSEEHKKHISEGCIGMKMPNSHRKSQSIKQTKYIEEHNLRKQVKCIETGKIWNSILEASTETKCQVSRCCTGKYLNSGNLHFEFVDEEERNKYKDKIYQLKLKWLKSHKPVKCLNNNKIYKTNCTAEKELGTEHHEINWSCEKNQPCKDGYQYCLLTKEELEKWIETALI